MAHAEWNSTCHVTYGKLPNREDSLFGFSNHRVALREIVQLKSAKFIFACSMRFLASTYRNPQDD